jgi:hypothetical protein
MHEKQACQGQMTGIRDQETGDRRQETGDRKICGGFGAEEKRQKTDRGFKALFPAAKPPHTDLIPDI